MPRPGRPSNKALLEKQQAEIRRLRLLISHKTHPDRTWQALEHIIGLITWLQDQDTPLTARTYGQQSHSAQTPLLPGTHLTNRQGDRNLYHNGRYAKDLIDWIHRRLEWTIDSVESKLIGKEPPPEPPGAPNPPKP